MELAFMGVYLWYFTTTFYKVKFKFAYLNYFYRAKGGLKNGIELAEHNILWPSRESQGLEISSFCSSSQVFA